MYCYEKEKPSLFTEAGQRDFLKVRDRVKWLLREAGAFRMHEAVFSGNGMPCGSSWEMMARIDRLVELGEIREVTLDGSCAGQHRVFVSARAD